MNLSFTLTRPTFALWWSLFWRCLVWAIMLALPLVLLASVAATGMFIMVAFSALLHPALVIGWTIIAVVGLTFLNYVAIPVVLYALAFRGLLKKGRFFSYRIFATYRGSLVKGFRNHLGFSWAFVWETLKYTWPLCIAGLLTNFLPQENIPVSQGILSLMLLTLGVYSYLLAMTDILRRRTFKTFTLQVDKA